MTSAWFETIDQRDAYTGRSTVRIETVRTPSGEDVEREVVLHDDAVAVVPVTDGGDVLLLRQYRQPVRRYLLEIPAGTLDIDGEVVEAAAQRELSEEIGHVARELIHLVTFDNSAGWTTERTHVYLGTGMVPVDPPDGYEPRAEEADMEVARLPLGDAVASARAGELSDAKTLIGLLLTATRLDVR